MSLKDYVSGFHHSQAGMDSADPNVQFYKNHHDQTSGNRRSSSKYSGSAIFVCIIGIGAAIERVGRAPPGDTPTLVLLGLVGLGLLIIISSWLNRYLVNYRRAAIAIFLFFFLFLAAYAAIQGVYRVTIAKEYWTWGDYFSVRSPLRKDNIGSLSIIFALLACIVALIPWIRRNFRIRKAAIASLVVLVSPFAIAALFWIKRQM